MNIQKNKKKIAPKLLGIDIEKISPIEGVNFIQMNINDNALESEINSFFENEQIDLIISDCSINKTGNKTLDQVSQIRLCNRVVEISIQFLKPDRFLVLKCFEGSELASFIRNLKNAYAKGGQELAAKQVSLDIVDDFTVIGSVEECIEKIDNLRREGFNQFSALIGGTLKERLDLLETYARKIIPRIG